MDEFVKISQPGIKKVIDQLGELKPFERIEIVADNNGKPDTFLVIKSVKMIISSGVVTYIK